MPFLCSPLPVARPILFSDPMVRALTREDDPKTQTRRPVTKPIVLEWLEQFLPEFVAAPENHLSPYGYAGDQLWVREAWRPVSVSHKDWVGVHYRADDWVLDRPYFKVKLGSNRWRPSIHMPRNACRHMLNVHGVRIEHLWDISTEDAFAEGIVLTRCPQCHLAAYGLPEWGHDDLQPTPIEAYWHLWDQINEARGYGRSKNPWVWVVDFRRAA